MKTNKTLIKGFSLIELSIVILIIGILVAGVTTSSRLVRRVKITSAQGLTQSAPVILIKDLAVWYESALDKSFIDSEESEGTPLTSWLDNNIQSTYKNDLKQLTVANQPKFSDGVINGLPSVRFDGVDDCFLSTAGISGNAMTLFLVGQRSAFTGGFQSGFAGLATSRGHWDDCLGGGSFILFMDINSSITSCTNVTTYYGTMPHPGNSIPFIYDIVMTGSNSNSFINGVSASSNSGAYSYVFDVYRVGCAVNSGNNRGFYNGYISEIIVYTRALNTEERKSIESYLAKKYAIKIS